VDLIKESKRVIFNGNGYSEEWQAEAGRRGLLNHRNTVDALPELISEKAVDAFERFKVLNERELHARYEINLEAYNKTVNVEAQLMALMANRYILPAALAYQTAVADNVSAVKAAGGSATGASKTLDTLCGLVDEFRVRIDALCEALEHSGSTAETHARHMRDCVIPRMNALRETGDKLELVMPSDSWPLPTYREMLFIK
jgi:glutamine synthetase